MDKRKYQRVALFAGLLFLILAVEGALFYKLMDTVREEERQRMGAMVLLDERLETDAARIFSGKNEEGQSLTEAQKEKAGKKGEALAEKYGYDSGVFSDRWDILKYGLFMGLFLAAGCIGAALILAKERRDRKKAQREAERLSEKIQELENYSQEIQRRLKKEENDTKSLITDISHQLKTPIASLKLSQELAQTTQLTTVEQQEFQKNAYEEVKKLETLLDSLMNLSKLEAKIIQIKPSAASLKDTLVNAVNSVYMKAFEKEIEISMEEFEDRIFPHDKKWTAEAFVNILDNSIKYSPPGTVIEIRAEALVSYMLIEIKDEGIGIPAGEAHKIFKRFYRGENEIVKNQEGSGVGLYLTRRILEEQGGTVSVKKGAVCGSVFRITLPLG